MNVGAMHGRLLDALRRFLWALDEPKERRVLAPIALREVIYHVLAGEQGDVLRASAIHDSSASRIARTLRYLEKNYARPLDIQTIARDNGISTSVLHHSFKAVTSMSPMQHLKQIRLHRARLLMLHEGMGCCRGGLSGRIWQPVPIQSRI